ncbi:MAG: hypothetical protein JW755_12375 [Candidatus Aminicenantes bacterium]|nr:hypothetical protein [Candidatus Aminicenantes bacterium]
MKKKSFVLIFLFFNICLLGVLDENSEGKIPFIKKDHYILVTAKINNSIKNFTFLIDTGGATFIDKSVVQELNLKHQGPQAKITTLNLSGYKIENLFCFTTFDFTIFKGAGTPIHGIIGSNLMERFNVTFDFQKCYLIFSTAPTSLTPSENNLYFTFRNHPVNNAPLIKFKINQEIMEGMIDTGQPFPVVLPFEDFEQFKESNDSGYIRSKGLMIKWPQTKPQYNYLTRLKSLELGSLKISNAICIFGEIPRMLSMPLIGTDLLFQFKMIINYPKDEMLLIPNPDCHFEDNLFSLGINLDVSEKNEIYVEGIWENSPADLANIQVGDLILSFDLIKITPENFLDLIEKMKDDHIESILFEIKNEMGIKKIKLNKALLF